MWFSQFPKGRKNRSLRPMFESLEDRSVPATHVWTGGALSTNWTNNNNWSIGAPNSADDVLVFPNNAASKNSDNNFPAGTRFAQIQIQDNGYNLRGARLRVGSIVATYTGTSEIKMPLEFTALTPITVNGTATLITNDPLSGVGAFDKKGTGWLNIKGLNSFAGNAVVSAGKITINRDLGLGLSGGETRVRDGAKVTIDPLLAPISLNERFTLDHGSRLVLKNSTVLNGAITLNGTATLENLAFVSSNIRGKVSGVGGFNFVGLGTVVIDGSLSNINTGTTFINAVSGMKIELNKPAGITAIAGNVAINPTTSGQNRLILRSDNQIANTSVINVQKGSLFDLNGRKDVVGGLALVSGTVKTGLLGEVGLNGTLTANTVAGGASSSVEGQLNLGAVSRTFQVGNGPVGNDLVVSAKIVGGVGITKGGLGTAVFNANNTYTGTTVVIGGTLQIDGNQQQTGVTVKSGATLQGRGTTGSLTVEAGGTMAPGTRTSTATFRVKGNFTMLPGSFYHVNLNGALPGFGHDQVIADGSLGAGQGKVVITGANLQFVVGAGSAVGNNMRIIDNDLIDNVTGTFVGLPDGAIFFSPGGVKLSIDYDAGLSGNDVVIKHEAP